MSYQELRFFAEMHEDAMAFRIAAENKLRSTTVSSQFITADNYAAAERDLKKALIRTMRVTVPKPVREWQKANNGIGEKLLARLLGQTGDPCIAIPCHWEGSGDKRTLMQEDPRPRTVGQLWSYCGHGDPGRKYVAGDQAACRAMGNPKAKTLVHLLSEACVKQLVDGKPTSLYRVVYDEARVTYADRTHVDKCIRCGPSGKPALPGSPWNLGHQHAAAQRKIGKEILRDLWVVSGGAQ
jgi:hypothetical protein